MYASHKDFNIVISGSISHLKIYLYILNPDPTSVSDQSFKLLEGKNAMLALRKKKLP